MPCALLSSSSLHLLLRPVRAGRPAGWSGCRRSWRAGAIAQFGLRARPRRPGDSAARAAWPRWATAPRRVLAPACGWPILALSMSAITVGHRPHALADLRLAAEARRRGRYRRSGPRRPPAIAGVFISPLRTIGAGIHRGVHLIAGAVEEAGVDEDDAVRGGADAFLQVDRWCGAPRPSRPS